MRKVILEDLLDDNLDVVFCGTAPGHASAAAGAYYAHKTNLFWPTLHAIGLTPHIFAAADFPKLKALRIGLTDIAKFEHGSDDQLGRHALGQQAVKTLRARILKHQPKFLAFTSKTGGEAVLGKGRHYGPQPETIGATKIWILPSTSFRARRAWDIAVWHALAREIQGEIRGVNGKIDVLAQSG
jgi:TDG/mug DNA glycosylase family protein